MSLAARCAAGALLAFGCAEATDLDGDDNPRTDAARPQHDAGADASASSAAPGRDAGGRDGVVAEPDDEAAYIYDQRALRTYELLLSPEDLARLDADPMAEQYVEGMLRFEGRDYGPLGIRYKGSVGAFRGCLTAARGGAKACSKLSMKVSFHFRDPEARFYGLRKLQFHAMNRDRSLLKERLGYAMFREFGLAAPRAVHARLRINGQFAGLFALVEQIDGRFTRSRFREGGRGNLYKEAWPLDADGRAIAEPALRARLETNEDEQPSLAVMLGFAGALEQAELTALPSALSAFTDVDYGLRYVAVDRVIAHDDGPFHWYCFGGPCFNHNFYWYEARADERLWIVAWDLDNAFNLDNTTVTVWLPWDDTSQGCEPSVQPPFMIPLRAPACDKLTLGWAGLQERYLEQVAAFANGPFAAANVEAKLATWEAQIAPTVEEAAAIQADAPTVAEWDEARAALRAALQTLRGRARARLLLGPLEVRDPWHPRGVDAGASDDGGAEPDGDGGT